MSLPERTKHLVLKPYVEILFFCFYIVLSMKHEAICEVIKLFFFCHHNENYRISLLVRSTLVFTLELYVTEKNVVRQNLFICPS